MWELRDKFRQSVRERERDIPWETVFGGEEWKAELRYVFESLFEPFLDQPETVNVITQGTCNDKLYKEANKAKRFVLVTNF